MPTFKLTTSSTWYHDDDHKQRLESLGFKYNMPTWDQIIDEVEIEINNFEELIDFVNKHGRIILETDEIEIYDDYRE